MLGGSEGGGFENFDKCEEKAEVKVGGAQMIEDGIQSTPTESWDPFTVLPKEIYMKIFNKLDNPSDKQNFMNAHVKLYELFKGERVKFLFGKVFENLILLDEKAWNPSWTEYDQNMFGRLTLEDEDVLDGIEADDEEEDDWMRERIWNAKFKNLTRLRHVCREWDRSIQNYYQFHPDHFQFVFCEDKWRKDSKHLKNQYPDGYIIHDFEWGPEYTARHLETDLDAFRVTHPPSKNPFLTRKVRIVLDRWWLDYDDGVLYRELFSQIQTLFETYGQHVWYFSFKHSTDLTPELYLEIVKWLKLMPELRSLQIKFECHYNYHVEQNQIELPEMKKLQSFHVSGFPNSVINKLLEGMKALEKVEVADPLDLLEGFKFPITLTELALKFRADDDIISLNSLQQFPLVRKLIINSGPSRAYSNTSKDSQPSWKTVWMAIEEKFPAVEDLHLSLPGPSDDRNRYKFTGESLDCKLNLQKLKKLSLAFPTLSSLDFLQEIKTVQELKIELAGQRDFEDSDDLIRRERIQFMDPWITMWESNIWEVFPNLRKLSIRHESGCVEIYHHHHLMMKRSSLKRDRPL